MRIAIIGAGAVGQGLAGFLAADGHEVCLLVRERFVEALRRGLKVTGVLGERVVAAGALEATAEAGELAGRRVDAVLVTVKSYDTAAAIPLVESLAGEPPVFSVQNGYGNVEALAERLGRPRVLCARVITGFTIPRAGEVTITVHADDIRVGSFCRGGHPAAAELAGAMAAAGIPCRAVDNVEAVLWGKILYNCALNALGAILGVHYGALGDSPEARAVMDAVIDEAFAVIYARGLPKLWPDAEAFREAFYGRQIPPTYDHRPSMLQDLSAGKRTEIDALNGAIVRLAREASVPAPVNETLVRIIRFMEAGRRQ